MNRRAVYTLSLRRMATLLGLPDGMEILAVTVRHDTDDAHIVVTSSGGPEQPPGAEPPWRTL